MKRNSLAVAFVLSVLCLGEAQTYEAEKAFLDQQFKSGKIDVPTTQKLMRQLEKLHESGFFDFIPYDEEANAFTLTEVKEAPGMIRRDIYRRILEWCNLKYSTDNEAVTYSDEERGKIIVKAFVPVVFNEQTTGLFGGKLNVQRNARLRYTLMVTVKDGKYKMEYDEFWLSLDEALTDVGQGYGKSLIFIQNLFPLTDTIYADTVVTRADLLRRIFGRMISQHTQLERYIKGGAADYGF